MTAILEPLETLGPPETLERRPAERRLTERSAAAPLEQVTGVLQLQDQHGFVRTAEYRPGPEDVYVPAQLIRAHALRAGDLIDGLASPGAPGNPGAAGKAQRTKAKQLARVSLVNGRVAHEAPARPHFAEMTPVHPTERLLLETGPDTPSTRVIDLIAPIGKGQRGLIVAPPKTGKTMLLQAVATAVGRNHPDCHLMVVLLDERPEEVTDMRRVVDAEIIASTFDRPAHEHIAIAELAVERAKRLAELGTDVVILLDSLTRLCRAHNNNAKPGGRTLSGGVDAAAVAQSKRLFGAARNLEEGGSVTILATALVDTGSRADDYYFEELKSTGNMELRLDRTLAGKRIYPAIELAGSSTRREELLVPAAECDVLRRLRRALANQPGEQATEILLERMRHTKTNAEFLRQVGQTTAPSSGF